MEWNKNNNEIYYYQIETWHQLDQDLDLSQQLKTNDLIFWILREVYTINLNHMVILVSSTSICCPGGGGTRSEKWWGCAAGRWKLDPKKIEGKMKFGA